MPFTSPFIASSTRLAPLLLHPQLEHRLYSHSHVDLVLQRLSFQDTSGDLDMDRPEPGLIKWSPNARHDSFLHINLQHRVVQLYEPSGHAQKGRFDYRRLSKHNDFPPLTTYDWSPTTPGLLAVGTGTGIVNLLRIDDNSNAYLELGLKMTRTCQAVAFSTQGLLAVGLDRVRMDQCLHIWDVTRVSSPEKGFVGLPKNLPQLAEPLIRLEPSVSISSIKFFEDSPQTLVVGIKGQGLRIHDLRGNLSLVSHSRKLCRLTSRTRAKYRGQLPDKM